MHVLVTKSGTRRPVNVFVRVIRSGMKRHNGANVRLTKWQRAILTGALARPIPSGILKVSSVSVREIRSGALRRTNAFATPTKYGLQRTRNADVNQI